MTLTTSVKLSPSKWDGHSGPVTFIGIHTMEAPEMGTTAEAVANYFMNQARQASAHWCVDNNSRVRCVRDSDSAWAMPPVNGTSLNIELAGYARQTREQWADAYSQAMLGNAAVCVAEWSLKFGIPVRRLGSVQIANRNKGLVGHNDINNVFHQSDHWDPGPNFPWSTFLITCRARLEDLKREFPSWPFPQDHYLGTRRPDTHCHSGYDSEAGKLAVLTWQRRMAVRGWTIEKDGYFNEADREVCIAFQREKGLIADGLVGPRTWAMTWVAPIT